MKLYRLRQAALDDIDQALDFYANISLDLEDGFQAQALSSIAHIQLHPATGSPRYANTWLERGTSQVLRFWLMNRFPHAIFYFEQAKYIDIVRVLHQASDIPLHLKTS